MSTDSDFESETSDRSEDTDTDESSEFSENSDMSHVDFSLHFLEFAEMLAIKSEGSFTVETIVDIWNTRKYRQIVIPPSHDDSAFTTLDQAIAKTLELGPIETLEDKVQWRKRYDANWKNPYYRVLKMTGDGWCQMERYEIARLLKRVGEYDSDGYDGFEVQDKWYKKCMDAGVKVDDLRW